MLNNNDINNKDVGCLVTDTNQDFVSSPLSDSGQEEPFEKLSLLLRSNGTNACNSNDGLAALAEKSSELASAIEQLITSQAETPLSKPLCTFTCLSSGALNNSMVKLNDALFGRNEAVVATLWKNNHVLQQYFRGEPVTVPVTDGGKLQIQMQIPPEQLITNFKAALASQDKEVIHNIVDGNTRLQSAVNKLELIDKSNLKHQVSAYNEDLLNVFLSLKYISVDQQYVAQTPSSESQLLQPLQPSEEYLQWLIRISNSYPQMAISVITEAVFNPTGLPPQPQQSSASTLQALSPISSSYYPHISNNTDTQPSTSTTIPHNYR